MKVRALKKFEDLKDKVVREPNTKTALFTCSKERYEEIVKGLGQDFIEIVEEEKKETKKQTKTKE